MLQDEVAANAVLATSRISAYVRNTPLDFSPYFSRVSGANVFLKMENLQHTGSFKVRGAFNKLLALTEAERAAGCVAASSGNHGAALVHAMATLGVNGIVFVPEQTSSAKVSAIRDAGGEVRFFGADGVETEYHAREYASSHGMHYVSPYNDPDIIAGQGTCGVEIARQLARVDTAFIAIGGGGLIAGAGAYLKSVNPDIAVVGCQPAASPVMTRSVAAGRILEMPSEPTLSDGTAGGIEAGAVTFELCRDVVDDYVLVSEQQIADAMRAFMDSHRLLIEGAAGVALAGLIAASGRYRQGNVVVIVCGGNISRDTLKAVI